MPRYEGTIAGLNPNGRAKVIIGPGRMGVPNVSPGVNRRVCHCATEGSTVTIEAVNGVGAEVGDLVSVNRDASALAKNAAVLLGIPAAAVMTGLVLAGVLMDVFSFQVAYGAVVAAGCFLIGIVVGVLCFKRVSSETPPVIDHILKKRLDSALEQGHNRFPMQRDGQGCDGCCGPFS